MDYPQLLVAESILPTELQNLVLRFARPIHPAIRGIDVAELACLRIAKYVMTEHFNEMELEKYQHTLRECTAALNIGLRNISIAKHMNLVSIYSSKPSARNCTMIRMTDMSFAEQLMFKHVSTQWLIRRSTHNGAIYGMCEYFVNKIIAECRAKIEKIKFSLRPFERMSIGYKNNVLQVSIFFNNKTKKIFEPEPHDFIKLLQTLNIHYTREVRIDFYTKY